MQYLISTEHKSLNEATLEIYTEELGLVCVKPERCLNLSPEDMDARIHYLDKLAGICAEFLMWEDENFFLWNGKLKKVWMIEEKRLRVPEESSIQDAHILAAISLRGRTELYILDQGSTWNSNTYVQALTNVLLTFITKCHKTRSNYFIQDNPSCHKSAHTQDWFRQNGISCIDHINPIEMIWAVLKRKVYGINPLRRNKLIAIYLFSSGMFKFLFLSVDIDYCRQEDRQKYISHTH